MRGALGGPRVLLRRLREVMAEPISAQDRLDKIVVLIAANMVAEVCSVYVLRTDGALELYATEGLKRGMKVSDTGGPITVPVGEGTLGRVFNVTGEPVDNRGPVQFTKRYPIHRPAPALTDQDTKAQILEKLSRTDEAAAVMSTALDLPSATPIDLHQYGRRLIAQGKSKEAMAVFEKNAKRFGDTWPTHVGLARGYSALGDYKSALKHAEVALTQAPDDLNRKSLQDAVARLKQGQDMNGR